MASYFIFLLIIQKISLIQFSIFFNSSWSYGSCLRCFHVVLLRKWKNIFNFKWTFHHFIQWLNRIYNDMDEFFFLIKLSFVIRIISVYCFFLFNWRKIEKIRTKTKLGFFFCSLVPFVYLFDSLTITRNFWPKKNNSRQTNENKMEKFSHEDLLHFHS